MADVASFNPIVKDGKLDLGASGFEEANPDGVGQRFVDTGQMDDGSQHQQLTSQQNPWEAGIPEAPQAAPPPQPVVDPSAAEIANLKRIVGEQGNQIGEYRKLLNTLASQQVQPQQQQVYSTAPARLIPNRNPDDYPTAKEVEESLYRAGEYLYGTLKAQMEESAAKAQLLAAGITVEEQSLYELQYPGIRNMDAQTRVGVISALVKSKRLEQSAITQAATTATAQVAQQGVRQRVFVEQPQAVTNIPSQGNVIDMDAFGKLNSKQMEQTLNKMGIPRVDDWNRRG